MQNLIGVGIWVVMGVAIGLVMKVIVKRPEQTPGHTPILLILAALASVIGGMLGVGVFEFYKPLAISWGGMGGALVFSTLMAWVYRWGVRGLV
jgi:small basic protein